MNRRSFVSAGLPVIASSLWGMKYPALQQTPPQGYKPDNVPNYALQPANINIPLQLKSLTCNHTTENGADEVYILVYATKDGGKPSLQRFPVDAPHEARGHWDMNDSDQPTDNCCGDSHIITDRKLGNYRFVGGQTLELSILLMEEDGGSTKQFQTVAAALSQKVPNPIVQGAGKIIGALTELGVYTTDTDDLIGSVNLEFESTDMTGNSGYNYKWSAGERFSGDDGGPWPLTKEVTLDFNGDGSRYRATFGLNW
jgi:hypothetical protein